MTSFSAERTSDNVIISFFIYISVDRKWKGGRFYRVDVALLPNSRDQCAPYRMNHDTVERFEVICIAVRLSDSETNATYVSRRVSADYPLYLVSRGCVRVPCASTNDRVQLQASTLNTKLIVCTWFTASRATCQGKLLRARKWRMYRWTWHVKEIREERWDTLRERNQVKSETRKREARDISGIPAGRPRRTTNLKFTRLTFSPSLLHTRVYERSRYRYVSLQSRAPRVLHNARLIGDHRDVNFNNNATAQLETPLETISDRRHLRCPFQQHVVIYAIA